MNIYKIIFNLISLFIPLAIEFYQKRKKQSEQKKLKDKTDKAKHENDTTNLADDLNESL